jgi:hypothetical protein
VRFILYESHDNKIKAVRRLTARQMRAFELIEASLGAQLPATLNPIGAVRVRVADVGDEEFPKARLRALARRANERGRVRRDGSELDHAISTIRRRRLISALMAIRRQTKLQNAETP